MNVARIAECLSSMVNTLPAFNSGDLKGDGWGLPLPAELSILGFPVRLGGVDWLRSGPCQA